MPLAVVDFAHTPDAVAAALKALRHNTSGSLIVVLGAGGDRDAGKRDAMGAAAAAHADIVFVTDDNPRSENPAEIRAALMHGAIAESDARPLPGRGGDGGRVAHQGSLRAGPAAPIPAVPRVREIGDRADAIRAAVALARVGDTVVVLGKGHESGQEIAGVVHPFDDRSELRAALVEHASSNKSSAGHERGPTSSDVIRGEAR